MYEQWRVEAYSGVVENIVFAEVFVEVEFVADVGVAMAPGLTDLHHRLVVLEATLWKTKRTI